MSLRVMNWVWEHSTAKGSELLLLLDIADAADDQGRNAFPSISTLAAKTRMSRRTVQRPAPRPRRPEWCAATATSPPDCAQTRTACRTAAPRATRATANG